MVLPADQSSHAAAVVVLRGSEKCQDSIAGFEAMAPRCGSRDLCWQRCGVLSAKRPALHRRVPGLGLLTAALRRARPADPAHPPLAAGGGPLAIAVRPHDLRQHHPNGVGGHVLLRPLLFGGPDPVPLGLRRAHCPRLHHRGPDRPLQRHGPPGPDGGPPRTGAGPAGAVRVDASRTLRPRVSAAYSSVLAPSAPAPWARAVYRLPLPLGGTPWRPAPEAFGPGIAVIANGPGLSGKQLRLGRRLRGTILYRGNPVTWRPPPGHTTSGYCIWGDSGWGWGLTPTRHTSCASSPWAHCTRRRSKKMNE
mmetsp:Transcript_65407/g.108724  ORF Transcript_65407/g.108724 Transcript_65407/m.108724 type:complete len:307 (+) Transcript_65407:705-1625(+)